LTLDQSINIFFNVQTNTKEQIDILLNEYKHLMERDMRLTAFYHRFTTIGATFIGAVLYYATLKPALYHSLPFLIPMLLLFLEYWRMDTVATNAYLARIEANVNRLAGVKLLTYKKIKLQQRFFYFHRASRSKVLNPMFVLTAIVIVAFFAVIAISYQKIHQYFIANEIWEGWMWVYCVLNGSLLVYTVITLFILETGKIYKFWDRIAKYEYPNGPDESAK